MMVGTEHNGILLRGVVVKNPTDERQKFHATGCDLHRDSLSFCLRGNPMQITSHGILFVFFVGILTQIQVYALSPHITNDCVI